MSVRNFPFFTRPAVARAWGLRGYNALINLGLGYPHILRGRISINAEIR